MEKYRAGWAVALEHNGSVLSPCVHRTYTLLKCACWAQRTTGTALGCEREPPQSRPVPAHWRTKNLCGEETRGTEPSVTWKGLATGVTGDKKVEASGTFGVQGHPQSPPEAPCVQTGRQARSSGPETMSKGYVIRSRKGYPRHSRVIMQPLPFRGLAGENPSTSPQYWLGWWLRTFFHRAWH